jgi:hypothetical protein
MSDQQPLTDSRTRRAATRFLDAVDRFLGVARELETARDDFSKAVRAGAVLRLVRPDEGGGGGSAR